METGAGLFNRKERKDRKASSFERKELLPAKHAKGRESRDGFLTTDSHGFEVKNGG
jgi:hypothetical protein